MNTGRREEVEKVLELITPAMEADGGGIAAFEIVENIVKVKLKGACLFCPSIKMTLKFGIERTLKFHLPWIEEVVPYSSS